MTPPPVPTVRVSDAALIPDEGPARLAISGLRSPQAVADELAIAGAKAQVADGRLEVVTTPSRLVDATGRALGRADAEALERVVNGAIAGWMGPPPDLEVGEVTLRGADRVAVMGVVNVTPDSFSDGGAWYDPGGEPDRAVQHGLDLVEDGADLVDVGGESTRPGADPVEPGEEIERVVPVIEGLVAEGITVSVDTRRADVARAAVDAGASMVNDVSAGGADDRMLSTVADLEVAYVAMHMRGEPATMQDDPRYDDVVAEVFDHLAAVVRRAVQAGVAVERVVVDPGIGFGKTLEHNLLLLRAIRDLTCLGRPVLVGVSRKGFVGRLTGVEVPGERVVGSVAAAALAAGRGASIVRAHDVAETVEAVRVAHALAEV